MKIRKLGYSRGVYILLKVCGGGTLCLKEAYLKFKRGSLDKGRT